MREELLWAQTSYITRRDGDDVWITKRGALPNNWLAHHLNGGPRFGVPLVRGTECHSAAVDLDDHDATVGWEVIADLASKVLDALSERGLIGVPFRSGGGNGINIWMIWERPQQARGVRAVLYEVVHSLGMKVGTGGVVKGEIEVFPVQDEVHGEDLGNHIALPRTPLNFWTMQDCDQPEWVISEPVPEVSVPAVDEGTDAIGLELTTQQIDELLGWIKNDDLDYDDWLKVMAALHGAGATLEQALAWSATSDKDVAADTERKFKSFKRTSGRVAAGGTLMHLASKAGWDGWPVSIADFPAEIVDYRLVTTKGRYKGFKVSDPEQLHRCAMADPSFPFDVVFDDFTQDVLLLDRSTGEWERLRDHHYYAIRIWFSSNKWEPVSTVEVRELVKYLANQRSINIATQWAEQLVWDGIDRMDQLLVAMGCTVDDYHRAATRYWWSAHGGRVMEPGCKADAIVVMQSTSQGVGKTSAIEELAPRIGPFSTYRDVLMDHLLNEDKSARSMRGALCANLDELRSVAKREAAEIKAALSKRTESYIPKFVENRSEFGRQAVIYATSNEVDFLDDHTGNRRYHVFAVGNIDLKWIRENRDQLWAQGVAMWRLNGVEWQLADQLGETVREEFSVETQDPWTDKIEDWLATADAFHGGYRTASILSLGVGMPTEKHESRHSRRVGKIMRELGYEHVKTKLGGNKTQKLWKLRGT